MATNYFRDEKFSSVISQAYNSAKRGLGELLCCETNLPDRAGHFVNNTLGRVFACAAVPLFVGYHLPNYLMRLKNEKIRPIFKTKYENNVIQKFGKLETEGLKPYYSGEGKIAVSFKHGQIINVVRDDHTGQVQRVYSNSIVSCTGKGHSRAEATRLLFLDIASELTNKNWAKEKYLAVKDPQTGKPKFYGFRETDKKADPNDPFKTEFTFDRNNNILIGDKVGEFFEVYDELSKILGKNFIENDPEHAKTVGFKVKQSKKAAPKA